MIHLLMFLATLVRASECSSVKRDLFYVMDQVPILAFFAIYALLVQFWAEVYYNAVDKLSTLTDVVKPAIRWFIVIVLLVQGLFWVFYASVWRNERKHTLNYGGYSRLLVQRLGMSSVPVELRIRSRKLRELVNITSIGTSCFMTRCALQIILSTEKRQLHDRSTWFVVVIYYALLEIVPALSVLYFNRRLPTRRESSGLSATSRPIRGCGIFFGTDRADHDGDNSLEKSLLRG
uniref:THH1/TOM1/TOM3 domain-containing protein n=1 Tax=Hyaloperonospora arabidopsidis (strain Emoy2) TaxID=559515 RepID=M4B6L3_HYAAE